MKPQTSVTKSRPFNFSKATKVSKPRNLRSKVLAKQTAKLKRNEKVLSQKAINQSLKNRNLALKNEAKLKNIQSKAQVRGAKLEADAQRGGPIGYFARRRQTKIAKGNAEVEMAKMEPKLSAKERLTRLQTEAKVKETRAKGAAVATAISALGGSIASKAESESRAKIKQAEADIKASEALTGSLNSVPSVTTDQYNTKSAVGLITGVR